MVSISPIVFGMGQHVANVNSAEAIIDLGNQPVFIPLRLKTVHFSTTSALAKVFLTSARFCQSALFVMRNQASSAGSSWACRSQNPRPSEA
jgi:hypothetical protein